MPANIEIRRKFIVDEYGHPDNTNGAYSSYVSMKMSIGEKITSGTYANKYKVTVDYITYYSESYWLNGGSTLSARNNYPLCVLFALCNTAPSATAQEWGPSAYTITGGYQQWTSKIPIWYTSSTTDKQPLESVSRIYGQTNPNNYYKNNSEYSDDGVKNRVIEIARYTSGDPVTKQFRLNSTLFGASSYDSTYNAYKVDQDTYPGVGEEYVEGSGDFYVKDVNQSLYSRIYVTNQGKEFYLDTDDLSSLYAWTNTYLYGSDGYTTQNTWIGWENAGRFSSWITKFTIRYDANGGSGAPSAQTKTYDSTLTLSSTKPTRAGYRFNNWNTKADGTGTSYASGGSYTANSDAILYAQWIVNTYTVTYNANGGTNPPAPVTVDAGSSTSQPSNPTPPTYAVSWNVHGGTSVTTPVNRSRSFLGWYTAASGGTKITWPYTPTADIILYAHWGNATVGTLPTTTKTGYNLKGWYTAASGGSAVSSSTEVSGAVTYHAQWTPITYTVKYYLDGVEQTSLAQTCNYDEGYSYKPLPTKTGHSVAGWYTTSSFTGSPVSGSFSNLTTTDGGTISRYAKSTPITYTIEYELNGGSFAHDLDSEYTQGDYKYHRNPTSARYMGSPDTGFNKYHNVEKPTKAGYTFVGWNVTNLTNDTHYIYYSGSGHTSTATSWTSDSNEGKATMFYNLRSATGKVTFTAVWTANTYTVKYYLDGVEQTSLQQSCTYDEDYTYKPLPTKPGHSVDGWWASSGYTGTKYSAGAAFNNLTTTNGGTVYRYAKSTPDTYTVQYNANGGTGAPSAQTKTYGVDLTLSSTKPTKSFQLTYNANSGTLPSGTTNPVTKNCTFNNWKATDGTIYASGGTYTKNEGTTLTAQWTNPTLGTLPTPTRTNYRFLGWYTSATGGSAVTSSTTMSEDRTIHAHWVQQVTLTYNTNGGSGSVASETKDTGSEFTIKNYTGTKSENVTYYANGGSFSGNSSTTKAGNMVFNGWADSSSATTAQYIYNDPTKGKVTLTANKIIYGVWTHGTVSSHPTITAKQVTLTYDPNGGTIPTVADRTKKVNLVHAGWATTQAKANAGTVDYGVSAAIPTGTTVYAVWTAGAIGALPTIDIFTSRTGYRLDVDKTWTTTQNGSTAVTSTTKISVDTTIYAKWEYKVIINGNGGLIYEGVYDGVVSLEVWKKYNVNFTTPSCIVYGESDPDASISRDFIGYATTSSGSKAYNPGFSYTSNAPITLYAVYQVKTYIVKFTDGYSNPEVVLKTQTVNHGGSATPPADPTRPGYTFSGWIGIYENVKIDTTVKAGWGFCPIWVKTSTGWRKYDPKENT